MHLSHACVRVCCAAGVPKTKYPTSELVRRKNADRPLEDEEADAKVPRGKKMWRGETALWSTNTKIPDPASAAYRQERELQEEGGGCAGSKLFTASKCKREVASGKHLYARMVPFKFCSFCILFCKTLY